MLSSSDRDIGATEASSLASSIGREARRIRKSIRELRRTVLAKFYGPGKRSVDAARDERKRNEASTRSAVPVEWDCLSEALESRGINHGLRRVEKIDALTTPDRKLLTFSVGGVAYCYAVDCTLLVADGDGEGWQDVNGGLGPLLSQKDLTNSILRRRGFSVPEGAAIPRDCLTEACTYFAALLATASEGVCVKPADGAKGRKVHIGIEDLPAFVAAFQNVAKAFDRIQVEEVVRGAVYRFFCIAGRVVAVRCGVPANVEGDGIHSIADLVRLKNLATAQHRSHAGIIIKGATRRRLEENGMGPKSVPQSGEVVWINRVSNLNQGAEAIDATYSIHQSYTALVEQAVQGFAGLILCGADLAIENAAVPATKANHHFIELNHNPGFSAHHFPVEGRPRDVAGAIVDYLVGRR